MATAAVAGLSSRSIVEVSIVYLRQQARHWRAAYVGTRTAITIPTASASSVPSTQRIRRVRSRAERCRGRECLVVRCDRRLRWTRLISSTTWSNGRFGSWGVCFIGGPISERDRERAVRPRFLGHNPTLARIYAVFAFFAFRASRYFLILLFAMSLCFAQTIPKIGAAVFLQPGTGQS